MANSPEIIADRTQWQAFDSLLTGLELKCHLTSRIIIAEDRHVSFPGERGVLKFHFVQKGALWVVLPGHEPRRVEAGSFILLPGGQDHQSATDLDWPVETVHDFVASLKMPCESGLNYVAGNGPTKVEMISGKAQMVDYQMHPIWHALPDLVVISPTNASDVQALMTTLSLAFSEAGNPRPGSAGILDRLLEIALLQATRCSIFADGSFGQAFKDPDICRVLAEIHGNPSQAWDLAAMASLAGLSRTAFVERFRKLIGTPPGEYLTSWRMHRASQLLQRPGANVAMVARAVGYSSEPAFSRAFKKIVGSAPMQFGRGQAAANPA
jgi:AraC-like DNA-binding protein